MLSLNEDQLQSMVVVAIETVKYIRSLTSQTELLSSYLDILTYVSFSFLDLTYEF